METKRFGNILAGTIAFTAWTVFSFLAHYFARAALQSEGEEDQDDWFSIVTVTGIQMLIGGIVMRLLVAISDTLNWKISQRKDNNNYVDKKNDSTTKFDNQDMTNSILAVAIGHLVASSCTNASLLFANAGSAFTIKASEPISSAVLISMLTGQKMETNSIISLPLVVAGAVGFVWHPDLSVASTTGLGMAFISNILLGIKNINIKHFLKTSDKVAHQLQILSTMSFIAAVILCILIIVEMIINPSLIGNMVSCLGLSIVSAVFHSAYNIISMCVILNYTSVIGHATANVLKRILIAAAFLLIGQRMLSATNVAFGILLVVGLLIYAFPKCISSLGSSLNSPSLWLTMMTALMVVIVATTTGTWSESDSIPNSPGAEQTKLDYTNLTLDERKFLKVDLFKHRNMSDFLSHRLRTTTQVLAEAERIHNQIFPKIVHKQFKVAVLVNVFTWANKGDQLIMIGQRLLLKRLGVELIYYCYYPGNNCDFTNVPRTTDLVVFIQGAGYIGHPAHAFVVDKTLKSFPNNRVVVFPISSCHPTPPCTEIKKYAKMFAAHEDVHILLRDRYSYMLAVNFFKTNENYLIPDSAFAIGPMRLNIIPVYDIIWLKRNDWESMGKKMPKIPSGVSHVITDWQDDWMNQRSDNFMEDHQLRAMSGMMFLSRAQVVITDRLHAHIMCVLLGKPHVVVNSNTMKQEHYFSTWEKSLKNVFLVNDNFKALEKALVLLKHN